MITSFRIIALQWQFLFHKSVYQFDGWQVDDIWSWRFKHLKMDPIRKIVGKLHPNKRKEEKTKLKCLLEHFYRSNFMLKYLNSDMFHQRRNGMNICDPESKNGIRLTHR